MTFYTGQKVVCVGWKPKGFLRDMIHAWDRFRWPYEAVEVGSIYTIASIYTDADDGRLMLVLHEVQEINLHFWKPGFGARGFRPLVEKKTDISFAHEILRDTDIKAPTKEHELT